MSITVHIPFYNPEPFKKEGFKQLTRYDYLLENINNLKSLSLKVDIYIHTHNNFLNNKKLNAEIIIHELRDFELNKGYLTWKVRSLMKEQINKYDYFIYLEHDIKFSEPNFQYWLENKNKISNYKLNLGFIIYEKSNDKYENFAVHIMKKFSRYIEIKKQKYFLNDLDNYCCFWIYDKNDFKNFINSKWWDFKKKLTNYRHYYGVTETSALGLHAFNIGYFKATVIPEMKNQLDERCFVEHITNNYLYKNNHSSEIKKIKKNNYGVENACKYRLNELLSDKSKQKKVDILYKISSLFNQMSWKFRIFKRLYKSILKRIKC